MEFLSSIKELVPTTQKTSVLTWMARLHVRRWKGRMPSGSRWPLRLRRKAR